MNYKILRFEEVESTNIQLKNMNAPVGTVAVSKLQTGGYGRRGRSFCSPSDGLYMSIVIGADTISEKLFIPVKAAVAVNNVLIKYVPCGIKWPNDIVTNGKKICGILAESSNNNIILGIGVNVNTPSYYFTDQNLPYATSLFAQTGKKYVIDDIFTDILSQLDMDLSKTEIIKQYKKNCITINKDISVLQGDTEYSAKAIDLTENGELVVQKGEQTIIVNSGEVSIRGSEYV